MNSPGRRDDAFFRRDIDNLSCGREREEGLLFMAPSNNNRVCRRKVSQEVRIGEEKGGKEGWRKGV